jgi:hypothetical protein
MGFSPRLGPSWARSVNRRGTHLPERKERTFLASKDTNVQLTHQQPRCEFGRTLFSEGECQKTGEVQLDGSLLCVPHAKLLRLKVQESALLGTVFEMDKWLDEQNNRTDQFRWRRMMRERDEVVEQLRFNRRLIEANKEIDLQK